MAKTAIITAEVEPELKAHAEAILKKMGLSISDAIALFLQKVEHQGELPFEAEIPNRKTRRAIQDADRGRNLTRYKNPEEFFKAHGI